jgi:hypothetical protein
LGAVKDVITGGVGGIIAYMYNYSKNKKDGLEPVWSNPMMFINMCIGGFTANTIGSFIPTDMWGRYGWIGAIGVSSYATIVIIESRFADVIIQRFLGGNNR